MSKIERILNRTDDYQTKGLLHDKILKMKTFTRLLGLLLLTFGRSGNHAYYFP